MGSNQDILRSFNQDGLLHQSECIHHWAPTRTSHILQQRWAPKSTRGYSLLGSHQDMTSFNKHGLLHQPDGICHSAPTRTSWRSLRGGAHTQDTLALVKKYHIYIYTKIEIKKTFFNSTLSSLLYEQFLVTHNNDLIPLVYQISVHTFFQTNLKCL